jgi:hypothetical protein
MQIDSMESELVDYKEIPCQCQAFQMQEEFYVYPFCMGLTMPKIRRASSGGMCTKVDAHPMDLGSENGTILMNGENSHNG